MARPMLALNPNARLDKAAPYVRPRVKQDRPAYGVTDKGFYDNKDKFWNPGEALYYDEEPSLNMVPLNKLGHDKLQALYDKLNAFGNEKSKKDKTSYTLLSLRPWTDDDENEDFPTPESVMGMKKEGENQAIR